MNLAIITARGGSKRIPRKNIREFCGKPIIAYSIEAALAAECFDEVMVSTDDEEIAEVAKRYGAKVPFFRSKENSNDHAATAAVVVEVIRDYEKAGRRPTNVCCIYPTAPFVTAKSLSDGYELMTKSDEFAGAFPVARFSFPIQRSLRMQSDLVSMFYPEHQQTRSQDLEPAYHDAGQFYWVKVEPFLASGGKNLYHKAAGLVLPERLVQDIDNEEDWALAELKFRFMQERPREI